MVNIFPRITFLKSILLVASITGLSSAHADCSSDSGLPDLNCDGSVKVVALGDSLVTGVGDKKLRGNGGYVVRTRNRLPLLTLIGHGQAGLRTGQLLKRLQASFAGTAYQEIAGDLLDADLISIDIGRNDRWLFGPPKKAFRNLERIRALIKQQVQNQADFTPVITLSVLLLPNRGSQAPWVKELNSHIMRSHSTNDPADLRFDKVSKRLLSSDNLHPTSKGYNALSKVYSRYIITAYPRHAQNTD